MMAEEAAAADRHPVQVHVYDASQGELKSLLSHVQLFGVHQMMDFLHHKVKVPKIQGELQVTRDLTSRHWGCENGIIHLFTVPY